MKRKFTWLQCITVFVFGLLFSANITAQTYKWQSLKMGGAGFVSGLITSKNEQNLMYARTDVGGAYRWNAADSSWIPLLDWAAANQSGFYGVESIAIDPRATNKVYMLVGINYFDNGKTAILKSNDYGQTFTTIDVTAQFKAHGNGMGRSNGERLQIDPNLGSTLYVGTRYNGLFKSTDAGLTWNRLTGLNITTTPNGNGISFVAIDSTSGSAGVASQKMYVGVSRYDTITTGVYQPNLYVSTDAGISFTPVAGGPTGYMPQRAKLLGNGDMIINYANGSGPYGTTFTGSNEPMSNGGIWKYNTGTGLWTNITPSGVSKAWGGISVDPNNPNRMIASTINNYQLQYASAYGDRIYLTTNGGATWRDVVSPGFALNTNGIPWIYGQAIHWAGSVEFDPFNTNKVYISSGNGVFSNNNIDVAGNPWKFEVKGLEETVPTGIISIPGGPLFTSIGDYDGFKYTDITQYGERYTPAMGTTTDIAYAGANPNYLVRVGSKIYYSTNQGASWTQTPVINGSQGRMAVSADGVTMLHCPTGSSVTYYSRNNGASWLPSSPNVSNAQPVADMVNPNIFYIYNSGSGNLNLSRDGGATFTVTTNIGSGGNKLIRAIPGKVGHVWAALYGQGLKRSVDTGKTFTSIPGVTACSAVGYGKAAAPEATYPALYIWGTVGGVTGIFRSNDEGATWVRINDDAHQYGGPGNAQFVMGDMNTYGTVYMSTVGRGVVSGQITGPVPISLASLHVNEAAQNGRPVAQLGWKTLTESNASHFTVERSTNARAWAPVGSVTTKAINGNSTAAINYEYPDDITGLSGLVYYRLKMADKNGSYVYSNTVLLNIGKPVKGLTVSISPNPVQTNNGAVVRFTADKDQQVVMKIMAANGALLMAKTIALQTGSTSLTLNELAGQPSGIYTLNVTSTENKKSLGVVRFVIK